MLRTYRIDPNSAVSCGPGFVSVVEKGKKALGGPLDVIVLLGHMSRTTDGILGIKLGRNTYFETVA